MLAKNILKQFRTLSHASRVTLRTQYRCFSATETEGAKSAAETPEATPEELAKYRDQWGIKYDDECFKFEKEWELIASKVEEDQNVYLESELGDL